MSRPRPVTVAALAFVVALFTLLVWRAGSPVNRDRGGVDYVVVRTNGKAHYLPRNANAYENVVTEVTARHFARDGFWHTHLLPNRGGAPNVSLYDQSRTQCETLAPGPTPLVYRNFFGQERAMRSLNGDCIYTHYPPLADWLFGGLARLGFERVFYYKLLAILLNSLLVWLVYRWLSGEVRPGAALVATALIATTPAFVQWADTLYYHCLQYLLLIAGLLAFREYLAGRRRRWLALTWLLYFAEALASYQLTLFFGLMLAGQQLLSSRPDLELRTVRRSTSRALGLLIGLATAPALAFLTHFALIVSLFGWQRATQNLEKTYADRVSLRYPAGLRGLFATVPEGLAPWTILLAGLLVVIAMRTIARVPVRRPLAWLGVLSAGAVSFMVAFPGTTSWHAWMMYRQFLPAVALLVALLVDATWLAGAAWRRARTGGSRGGGFLPHSCAVLGSLLLAWVALHNAERILGEARLHLARARAHDPDDLVNSALDVVYWNEAGREPRGIAYSPVTGLVAGEPPAWNTDFRLPGPEPSHYEVWWLDPVAIGKVDLLVDSKPAAFVAQHCSLGFFDGLRFVPGAPLTMTAAGPTTALSGPGAWLESSVAPSRQARAVRVTCAGLAQVTLRQLRVFGQAHAERAAHP
jgi:4-amino-4-deoxy-L-arabinose transferase-like glycosyltransferase